MQEFWGMQSTPLLPSFPGPFWPEVVASERVVYMDEIELNFVFMQNWIAWNRTVLISKMLLTLNWTVFDI